MDVGLKNACICVWCYVDTVFSARFFADFFLHTHTIQMMTTNTMKAKPAAIAEI
jgi:hypothetical protein